jgi:hypothetical protein
LQRGQQREPGDPPRGLIELGTAERNRGDDILALRGRTTPIGTCR